MIVFGARTATVDWGQMYLIEEKNQSQYVGMCKFTSDIFQTHVNLSFCKSETQGLSKYNNTLALCYKMLDSHNVWHFAKCRQNRLCIA